jgi:hypothetical protein
MDPFEGDPSRRADGEPPPRPATESDAPPERASLGLLFGAAAVALALLLVVVGAVAFVALRP